MSATLPERLRALHATRVHHFTPVAHGGQPQEPAFAIVATEARLQDLLEAADALDGLSAMVLTNEQVRQAARDELASWGRSEPEMALMDWLLHGTLRRLGISL